MIKSIVLTVIYKKTYKIYNSIYNNKLYNSKNEKRGNMEFTFERYINYYETDKMGVVHHSNYIRFLEEARCKWLKNIDMPFEVLEENGITIPVLGVNCNYKYHVTFGDTIIIKLYIKEYTGVRMTVGYEITNKKTNTIVLTGETRHCFTDKILKPINLKKYKREFSDKFEKLIERG